MHEELRSRRRCADQLLVLRGLCEVRKSKKKTTYMDFLDITKAYDSMCVEGGTVA